MRRLFVLRKGRPALVAKEELAVKLRLQIPDEQHFELDHCQICTAKLPMNVIFRSRMQHEQLELSQNNVMANHRGLFTVRVRSDSMEPTFSEGDIVLFVRASEPESGKIVAVHVPDDGLIIKRFQRVRDTWITTSDNPAYPPRELKDGERILDVAKAEVRRA